MRDLKGSEYVHPKKPRKKLKHQCTTQLQRVRVENAKLKNIIEETLWMAGRYADGRSTYAPTIVNRAIMTAIELGCSVCADVTLGEVAAGRLGLYAKDGQMGFWNPNTKKFEKE